MKKARIVTVGVSPTWDITCRVDGIEWGDHKEITGQVARPAGKALNVSQALAWMGKASTAAGLWGQQDNTAMREALLQGKRFIRPYFTVVPGRTRQNLTVIDTDKGREMHLRAPNELADRKALKSLRSDLKRLVDRNTLCVFSGALPGDKLLDDVLQVIQTCQDKQAKMIIDTSGVPLKTIVDQGGIWLIKPNVEELAELTGATLSNNIESLVRTSHPLLAKVEHVLVSRGRDGALLLNQEFCLHARYRGRAPKTVGTVGCGDYLLAGFLAGITQTADLEEVLTCAVQAATAKAWGMTETYSWNRIKRKIKVDVEAITAG
ncbi:MAG: hypothetical protein JW860_12350 [Sedimentisphaerales bacterium]|nr:hypothetical protein [Sedimentisphaerales bacterium]